MQGSDTEVDYEDVMDGTVVSVDGDGFVGDLVDRDDVLKVSGHEFSTSQVAEADRGKVVTGARFTWRQVAGKASVEF